MSGFPPPACSTIDCSLLQKIFVYILSQIPYLSQQDSYNIIRNVYYSLSSASTSFNNYLSSNYPAPKPPGVDKDWTVNNAVSGYRTIEKLAESIIQSESQLKLLYSIVGSGYIPLTACPAEESQLDLSFQELIHLWNMTYCRVNLGQTLNYKAIPLYANSVDVRGLEGLVEIILNGFQASERMIDATTMTKFCATSISYDSMTNEKKKNLCGCYTTLPTTQYTGGEISAGLNSPQCLPTCLTALVKRFEGGQQQNCNQNLCIIDNIVTNGVDVNITNVCPICQTSNPRPQCICYIHVNDVIVSGQEACRTVTHVDATGNVTTTTDNSNVVKDQTFSGAIIIIVVISILFVSLIIYVIIAVRRRMQHNLS